ncbi:optic atrophy 3 protein homolog isoform X1 [Dendrobium catenatum]|uniref:optic atrophy 3 protein homolog isoform X1 n=1 Tax=Dendrobium catenatum TaxID=906689 RepID=UPI0009F30201|nr:optic atrophy 3 protein homolog isoform X1 [Dendrobium catenatum]
MILPLAKLGTLALKTFCKPIANQLKKEAGVHPKFRRFIVSIAQANHRITTNIQRRIYGHATNVEVRPLNEEKAVQAAADLIGELFVFLVAGSALIFEVQRSARSEARKEEARKQEIEIAGFRRRSAWEGESYLHNEQLPLLLIQQKGRSSKERSRTTRKQWRMEAMKHRVEDLAKELELLKRKLNEIEHLASKRGLSILNFRHGNMLKDSKPVAASS